MTNPFEEDVTAINEHLVEQLAPIIDKLGWILKTTKDIGEDDYDWIHSAREDLINVSGEYVLSDEDKTAHLIDQAMEHRKAIRRGGLSDL